MNFQKNNHRQPFEINFTGISVLFKEGIYHLEVSEKIERPVILKVKPTKEIIDFKIHLHLKKGASLTLIEDWPETITTSDIDFSFEAEIGKNASLKWIQLQNLSSKSSFTSDRLFSTFEGGSSSFYSFNFGGNKIHSTINQTTKGISAKMNSTLVSRLHDRQDGKFIFNHSADHSHTTGEIVMKGVSKDSARLDYIGGINIGKKGKGTSTYLTQNILNLGPKTTVKTLPLLNIDTNDVRASHGSGIQNVNPEHLFYLKSRGLDADKSRKLLIEGFLRSELDQLNDLPEIQKWIEHIL